jgi:hypothetical protein
MRTGLRNGSNSWIRGKVANRVALAEKMGITPGAVTRILKMVELSPAIQEFLASLNERQQRTWEMMRRIVFGNELSVSCFHFQILEIQRACHHGELAVGSARPLFGGTVPVKFDAIAVRVAEIECLAHAVICGTLERNAGAGEAE